MSAGHPFVSQTVLDCRHPRVLAEFHRELPGYSYRAGDGPPPAGEPDPLGEDWLVLRPGPDRGPGVTAAGWGLTLQADADYVPPVWTPGPHRPGNQQQMLHLDLPVPDAESLERQRDRVLALGGCEPYDRSDDVDEPSYVFADPAGHPFCIFVSG